MQFYKVEPDPRLSEMADGRYTWYLPSVTCEACGRSSGGYIAGYPNLDIHGKLHESAYQLRSPVTCSEFEALKQPLVPIAEKGRPLLPGLGFGPFRGTVKHTEKRDFMWVWSTELLPREPAWAVLTQKVMGLRCGPAVMRDRKTNEVRQDYRRVFDLEMINCLMRGAIQPAFECKQCASCGVGIKDDDAPLVLRRSAIPHGTVLFVPKEFPRLIIASEVFAEAARDARLNNISFSPVAAE